MPTSVEIIVPVFNESKNIQDLIQRVDTVFAGMPDALWRIVFVDDGSADNTLQVLQDVAALNPKVKYISFSRNFGKDNALKAGIDFCTADVAVTLDGDLQHPPELIPEMMKYWREGHDIVYAFRKPNKTASRTQRIYSSLFYTLLNRFSNLDIEHGIADFRLLDKKVVKVLKDINEFQIFLRGMTKWVGYKQKGIEYEPGYRKHGETTYTKKKLISLALQGITSFSTKPLYVAAYLGTVISLLSLLYIPYAIFSYFKGWAISGWSSLMVTIAFLGGLQLSILGIIGLYLGKIFMQTKHRPLYIISHSNYESVG